MLAAASAFKGPPEDRRCHQGAVVSHTEGSFQQLNCRPFENWSALDCSEMVEQATLMGGDTKRQRVRHRGQNQLAANPTCTRCASR